MNRETLISIINKNGIRFLPVRRCSLCDEYIGYKFVRMCDVRWEYDSSIF